MAKHGSGRTGERTTTPADYPETTPPVATADVSKWLLNQMSHHTETLGRVEATLAMLQAQIDRMETKVDSIKTDIQGHGRWVHTLKYVLSGLGILMAWFVAYAIGPWIKTKLFP